MNKGRTHIKADEFKSIKALASAGVSVATASRATGRSYNTVDRIFKSTDFENYTHLTQVKNGKAVEPVVEEKHPDAPVPSMNDLMVSLHKRNVDAQERQASALERLADAWENSPKKRSLF